MKENARLTCIHVSLVDFSAQWKAIKFSWIYILTTYKTKAILIQPAGWRLTWEATVIRVNPTSTRGLTSLRTRQTEISYPEQLLFEYTEEAQMSPSFLSKMARHLPWWHVFLLDDGLTLLDTYRYSRHWKDTRAMILYRDDRSNVTQIPVRIIYVNQFSLDFLSIRNFTQDDILRIFNKWGKLNL